MSTHRRGEEGTITAMVIVFTIALFAMAGLVVDGSRLYTARRHARDVSAAAARAGAQALDVDAELSSGAQLIAATDAANEAQAFLRAAGETGTVTVVGDRVRVRVNVRTSMLILGLAGVGDKTVTASGEARSTRGVDTAP